MNKERLDIIIKIKELISAFADNMGYEDCVKRIDALLSMELSDLKKQEIMETIYWASKIFCNFETYSKVFRYLENNGMPLAYLDKNILYYWLMKYFTGNDTVKKLAAEWFSSYIVVCYNNNIGYLLMLFMTENKKIIQSNSCDESKIKDCMYLYIKEKNTSVLKALLDAGLKFDMDMILKIAVEEPELYYGYLAENFFSEIPVVFKIKNRLRTIDNLIPFLLKSKKYDEYLDNNIFEYMDVDYIYIIIHWYKIFDISAFKNISVYFPVISAITYNTCAKLLTADLELKEIIFEKTDDTVIFYGDMQFYNCLNLKMLRDLKKIFKGKQIRITYSFLSNYTKANDVLKVITLFDDQVIEFVDKDFDYYRTIIDFDYKKLMEKAVKCGIITGEVYEQAIEYAVNEKKYNSLDVLREKYDEVNCISNDVWGYFTEMPEDTESFV